eukprot:c26549_g2_i1 orf=621-1757(+)
MEANAGLVAGSHNRNELVVIGTETTVPRPLEHLSGQICQICGDDVGVTTDGELFVACNECAFPVCRPCYEYERKEGNQSCPQCKTRYKRHRGSLRVDGDEEEDDVDDLENEFDFASLDDKLDGQYIAEAMLHGHMSYGRGGDHDVPHMMQTLPPQVPLLTNGTMVNADLHGIPHEQHALVIPPFMGGGGKRVHPLPYLESNLPVQPRSLDPTKDLAAYGYGSVTWKDRMETWKTRHEKMQVMATEGELAFSEGKDGYDDHGGNGPDLPIMDEARQPLSRKVPIPSARINPYRMIIILRLVVLGFFLHYRILNPVPDAYALWLVSVICEIWFALSWILDQFPKWFPINRETYLDRLSLRYEKEGKRSLLGAVDIYVSTV